MEAAKPRMALGQRQDPTRERWRENLREFLDPGFQEIDDLEGFAWLHAHLAVDPGKSLGIDLRLRHPDDVLRRHANRAMPRGFTQQLTGRGQAGDEMAKGQQ